MLATPLRDRIDLAPKPDAKARPYPTGAKNLTTRYGISGARRLASRAPLGCLQQITLGAHAVDQALSLCAISGW
jgi:hypothetical protein